ncbi:hypothetical protein [Microcoleus sp. AT8-B5]|uniref:hypothetical protein n=1 Tax=Microcoleus sp. AT8-B5 TaxID=2818621 RepID=UPI002FD7A8D9
MRRTRLFALALVSFVAVLIGALFAPGTFVNRALSTALCTVFSFNSTICTVNLVNSSDQVVAATPPAMERNISDWLVQRVPGEFDDAPSVPAGSNPQAPPFPQDPGPNQPLRPDFNSGGSPPPPPPGGGPPPPPLDRSPASFPSPDVNRAIDSATKNATGEALDLLTEKCDFSSVGTSLDDQKCFGATGNQCEGGIIADPFHKPRYNNDTCMVEAYSTKGSRAHDQCCVEHPRGYACGGLGNWNHTEDPKTSVCKAFFDQAWDNSTHNTGTWKEYGPYYNLTGTWTAKIDPFYTADREPGCHPGSIGAPLLPGANEFTMVQSGRSISIPGNFGGWSSTTGSKGYGSAAGGTVSDNVFTLRSTAAGFTNEHTGTISSVKDGRNTITGRVVCSHSSGSAKAEGSFTFTRKKS